MIFAAMVVGPRRGRHVPDAAAQARAGAAACPVRGRRGGRRAGPAGLPDVLEPARARSWRPSSSTSSACWRSSAGLLTVTSRNPVYSALWFASVVLSTSGLFLLADAPFLAAGTIIVYAGAIIVTFLFVIMLAQMEGKADYDRAARSPGLGDLHLLPDPLVPDRLRRDDPHRVRRVTPRAFAGGWHAREPRALRRPRRLRGLERLAHRHGRRGSAAPHVLDFRAAVPGGDAHRRPAAGSQSGRVSEAARRRPGRVALHRPPGGRRHRRRLALRGPDRGRGDHQPPATDPARHRPGPGRRAGISRP